MLFSLDASVAVALVIEHAPQASELCPNIAVTQGTNKFEASEGARDDADT
jgi:hypothetical protein